MALSSLAWHCSHAASWCLGSLCLSVGGRWHIKAPVVGRIFCFSLPLHPRPCRSSLPDFHMGLGLLADLGYPAVPCLVPLPYSHFPVPSFGYGYSLVPLFSVRLCPPTCTPARRVCLLSYPCPLDLRSVQHPPFPPLVRLRLLYVGKSPRTAPTNSPGPPLVGNRGDQIASSARNSK